MKTKLLIVGLVSLLVACSGNRPVKSDELVLPLAGQTGIYYFRTSVRCETCNAIEEMINSELEGKYAQEVRDGKIVFRQFNLDDPGVADFALQFDVVFKSLIILHDDQKTDLTNDAFLYALSKPDKLKQLFEQTIDQY